MEIVHNITFHVNEEIEKEWIAVVSREYIPIVREAVSCSRALFTRVRVAGEDDPTFSLQLFFNNDDDRRGEQIGERIGERIEESLVMLSRRFPGGFLYFRVALEEIIHEP
jgi:hypothetical protein